MKFVNLWNCTFHITKDYSVVYPSRNIKLVSQCMYILHRDNCQKNWRSWSYIAATGTVHRGNVDQGNCYLRLSHLIKLILLVHNIQLLVNKVLHTQLFPPSDCWHITGSFSIMMVIKRAMLLLNLMALLLALRSLLKSNKVNTI